MTELEALMRSFSYDPVLTGLLVFLATLATVSVIISTYIGVKSWCELLQQKRRERLRDAAHWVEPRLQARHTVQHQQR